MKLLLTILALFSAATPLAAQELIITSDEKQIPLAGDIQLSEQLPFQQLIGYAIEVSSAALSEEKPVGRYRCERIYSMQGYDSLAEFPCELIVHSIKGPIVVRYKDVPEQMDAEIKTFLTENEMNESLYYNKGRFRFALDEPEEVSEEETSETAN